MKKNVKLYLILFSVAAVLLSTTLYQIKLKGQDNNIILSIIVIAITVFAIILSARIWQERKIDEMFAFKILIPIIAILFIMAMPIFRSHDEDAHWLRIYDISLGNFLTSTEKGYIFQEGSNNYPAAELPRSVSTILDKSYDGSTTKEIFDVRLDENDIVIYAMPTTAIYSPTQYFPQALGVVLARQITDRPIIMAYAARMMNIVFSFTALYFAMKLMPFGKKILFVIMSIPIALEGFSSLSPDGMTISLSFLFIAYVLHLSYEKKEEKLTWKQGIILTVLGVLLALCKIVYLPLIGLMLLLPKTKFNSRKSQVLTIIFMVGIAILANLTWLSISTSYLAEYKEGRPVDQLENLLSNPIEYLEMLVYSIDLYGAKYFLSMYGGEVGLNEYVILNTIIPFLFFVLSIISAFTSKENRPQFTKFQNIIILLIVLAIVGLIFTSLYLQWTKTDSESIMGIQGRYFLPILPLALILLGNLKVKIEYSETTILKLITTTIFLMQICIIPLVFCIRTTIV